MNERARRIGLNEALFREVNEKVRSLGETFGEISGSIDIVCECGDATCIDQVTMAVDDYAAMRADPLLFVVKPGHETADVESVVDRRDDYDVVRKHPGSAATLAHETKPTAT